MTDSESDEQDADQNRSWRDRARRGYDGATAQSTKAIGKARAHDRLGPVVDKVGDTTGKAVERTKDLSAKGMQGVQNASARLTLEEYRVEMEALLDEALGVIAAQEAELAALRERIDRLEGQHGG